MNRRQFIAAGGAVGLVASQGVAPGSVSAASSEEPARMKLGDQTAPTNEVHLKYLARYGVRNICGYPHIEGDRLSERTTARCPATGRAPPFAPTGQESTHKRRGEEHTATTLPSLSTFFPAI